MRIRSHLLLLALGVIVPVLSFALVLATITVRQEQAVFAEGAVARLRATMTATDVQVEGHITSLEAVAASSLLEEGNFRRFHAEMARVLHAQPDWHDLVLAAPDGGTIASAARPYGDASPRPRLVDPAVVERVVRTKSKTVGGMAPVAGLDGRAITIAIPVRRAGEVRFVLAAVVRPESFTDLIEAQRLGENWVSGLVDADGRFIARIPPAPVEFASSGFRAAMARSAESWYRGASAEGKDVYSAHVKSAVTDWSIGLGIPAAEVTAGATRTAWIMGGGIVVAITLALLFAFWLGKRISEPVDAIAEAARDIGRGEPVEAGEWQRVAELRDVGAALREAGAAVREREMLMEREKRALEESDRAKDAFIAMLSHELRNPLASIVSAGDLLDSSEPGSEAARHARAVIRRQSAHMGKLIDDLLDISRVVTGKANLQLEAIDLAAVAETLVDNWQSAGRFRGERVSLDLSPAWIRGDRARIEQIFTNLLDNSIKFSSPAQAQVAIRVASTGTSAVLQVSDKGRGMSKELAEGAFGLFVQGEQGIARPLGGMGVGLALVKRLAELHGGSVSLSSEPGKGTTFVLHFPSVAAPPEAGQPDARPPEPKTGLRVLVVEDGADFRSMLAATLRLAGHEAIPAGDGKTGVALAMETKPDVVLVDIGLPDIDGYQVARLLRTHCSHPMALIALSGYGQPADKQKAAAAGFDDHLTKPAPPEAIARAIEEHAPGRRQRLAS